MVLYSWIKTRSRHLLTPFIAKTFLCRGSCHNDGCLCCWVNTMSMRQEAPEEQKRFYDSKEWQACRMSYISSVGGLCERCEAKGIIKPGKIVHHKDYITIQNITDPAILLNPNNLEYLCQDCHNAEHHKNIRRYSIDEYGRVTTR